MEKRPSDAELVAAAIAKFTPAAQRTIAAVRRALRARFPTAFELVYDNYNFFVIGYCTTERPSDCVISLVADANGIGISFYRGAAIDDPDGILEGSGKQNRFVRLGAGAATLALPGVARLIDAAEAAAPTPMRARGRIATILRSVSEKQRPRRK